MTRYLPVIVFSVILATLACSSGEDRRREAQRSALDPSESVDDIYAKRFVLEDFEHRLDAARNFYANGNGFLFQSTRDSLVTDVNMFIRANPHIENDQDFARFFNRLEATDTLEARVTVPYDGYSAVEDSLALSFANWPDLDVELDPGLFSQYNTVFPSIENNRIDFWVKYFTGPGRERFELAMHRMELYRPVVEGVLNEMDLPKELMCVALIESGYSTRAVSSAQAVGPWQFIRGTAKIYGLRVNWWYDERRDIVASTYAACHYLEDLHGIWGDWFLALSAYNCGEYRVARQVARQRTENFWKLRLPRQTQRYVPKFLAALYILRDPAKYGFATPFVEPIEFDLITVKDATDLSIIARYSETTVNAIKELNPQCRRWATPPNMEVHIKVPKGKGDTVTAALENLPPEERITWRRHRVRRGETLSQIADHYGTSISAIKQLNGIRNSHFIREGKSLLVPIRGGSGANVASATSKPQYMSSNRSISRKALENYAKKGAPPKGYQRIDYTVKPNDTLGEIAEVYRTSARRLRAWNNLSYRRYIYPGQRLAIYVPESFDVPDQRVRAVELPDKECCEKLTHVVRRGENLYSISRRYDVTLGEVLAWNNKSRRSVIHPGERIHIWKKKQ